MSRFIGYQYPELTHFFGLSAMMRLEKKIHPRFIEAMEKALYDGLHDDKQEAEFLECLEDLPLFFGMS